MEKPENLPAKMENKEVAPVAPQDPSIGSTLQVGESNEEIKKLTEILEKIGKTHVYENGPLIDKVVQILENPRIPMDSRQKAQILTGLIQRAVHVNSPERPVLVKKVINLLDSIDLSADQKIRGLKVFLGSTGLGKTEEGNELIAKMQECVGSARDIEVLKEILELLRFKGSSGDSLKKEIEGRLAELGSIEDLRPKD